MTVFGLRTFDRNPSRNDLLRLKSLPEECGLSGSIHWGLWMARFQLVTPSHIRYAAPANFSVLKAQAVFRRISEIPRAETVAWTKRPEQMPRELAAPSRQPPRPLLRIMSIVSRPGVMVSRVTAIRQVIMVWVSNRFLQTFSCLLPQRTQRSQR